MPNYLVVPYYMYDPATGEYRGEVPFIRKDGASPPDNTTEFQPHPPESTFPVWDFISGRWGYVEDHRGKALWHKNNWTIRGTQTALGPIDPEWASKPPPIEQEGFVIIWKNEKWEYLEDHRGLPGWRNGVKTVISTLGPLPEDFTTTPPPAPEPEPPPPDTRTPEEKRRAAYRKQVDPLVSQAVGYEKEADAWQARGEIEKSEEADAKAQALLEQILLQKEAIRELYPEETK